MKGRDNMKKKEIKKGMDIVFLLDRSGSMAGIESDTIGGYNSYINENIDKDVKVTTVLFDNEYEMLTKRENIKNIKEMTTKEYYVRGSTALLDAIGQTINYLDNEKAKKVMFIITTDGLENSSRNFTKEQIKEMIQGHKNWEFIYIGANIDSYSEGSSLGIDTKNISNYKKDKRGVSTLFNSVSKASTMYMCNDSIDYSWKDDLENYINENKE